MNIFCLSFEVMRKKYHGSIPKIKCSFCAQGLTDLIIGDQPSFSVVSRGADCLLINKQFYLEHASEKLLRDMRQEVRAISVL